VVQYSILDHLVLQHHHYIMINNLQLDTPQIFYISSYFL